MDIGEKEYFGKLLLFGEYTIILGAEALAIPIKNFSGRLRLLKEKDENNLSKLLEHIRENCEFDLKAIKEFDEEHLFFESNIPIGYGVGSSGALTAAIYDEFVTNKKSELHNIKNDLAKIEDYFHGTSSGIDPLVSFMNHAIVSSGNHLEKFLLAEEGRSILDSFYLMDTGVTRSTGPFVEIFRTKLDNPTFVKKCNEELMVFNKNAIQSVRESKLEDLKTAMASISAFQFEFFQEMILSSYRIIWKESLKDDQIQLKLCGAGGGGFVLAYCEDKNYLKEWADSKRVKVEKILF